MTPPKWTAAVPAAFALSAALAACLTASISGCGGGGAPGPPEYGYVEIRVNWPGADALAESAEVGVRAIPAETERLRITISGPDIEPIVAEITKADIEAGTTRLTIQVPVGAGRTVTVRALDATGKTVAAGESTVDIEPGATVRARVVLVASNDTEPPPVVISRTIQLTGFAGNFVPLEATDSTDAAAVIRDAGVALPAKSKSGTLTLDFFEAETDGVRPVVATLVIHNAYELWLVRGYYEGLPGGEMEFRTGVANDYITDPGGYTTSFSGSLLDLDILIGPILYPIINDGRFLIDFGEADPLEADTVIGEIDIGASSDVSLIGDLDGELVF